MTATEWTGLAGTYLPIYVGLHTVIFLLVHRFLAKRDQSSVIRIWPTDTVFAVAGGLSLLLLYIAFDTAMGLSGVLVAWVERSVARLCCHRCRVRTHFATFTNSSARPQF